MLVGCSNRTQQLTCLCPLPARSGHHRPCWLPTQDKWRRAAQVSCTSVPALQCPSSLATVTLKESILVPLQQLWALPWEDNTGWSRGATSGTTCPFRITFLCPGRCRNAPPGSKEKAICHPLPALGHCGDALPAPAPRAGRGWAGGSTVTAGSPPTPAVTALTD